MSEELKKLVEDVSMKIDNVVSEIMNIENMIEDSNHVLVQGRIKGIVEGISRTTIESLKLLKQALEDDLVDES